MAEGIGVGIIGASRVAPEHARAVQATGRTWLAGIADPDTARAEIVAEPIGCEVYADYRDLLKRPDVGVVMLGLPNDLHCPIALDGLDAGKHVFVEKPMANTLDECDRMIEAAERNGVRVFVGHSQRFFSATVMAREAVRSGRYGAPVMARDTWTKAFGVEGRPPWFLDRSRGGGMWLMNGAHMIDRTCWVLGSGVVAVSGWVGNPIHGIAADDASIAYLRLKNGLSAHLFHAGFKENGVDQCGVELVLTDGMIEFDSYANRFRVAEGGQYVEQPVEKVNPFVVEFGRMVDSIETGAPLAVPMGWARHIVAVMLAAEESGRNGREVVIPDRDYAEPDAG
ncbi:MAG: Gfo/Idh/MocA family oxidoreductase [Chloroflexota bacterium]|nr:Gfo/Idh/MocA family oxidoreductase [Chloroflexota bacterium]